MKYLLTGFILCCISLTAEAQHSFRAIIIGGDDRSPLSGVTLTWKERTRSFMTDTTGSIIINDIPPGRQTFVLSYVGFEEKVVRYNFPLASEEPLTIYMEPGEEEHEEEVIVTATRTSRTIANTATRTEVISGEELSEKGNMKPGDIRMLLNESTGIQTQQTSATSFNAGIRIQGLDGRYTQILRDGYPVYSGFSGGLSILQIAPLDLRQVEVIKGSASTLYGGGAIAGLVNLVSKTPGAGREISFLANATSARGLDLSGFYSERFGKTGLTVFGSRNTNAPFDPANIGLTAIPKFKRYTINPRFFIYGQRTTADLGVSYITEQRIGGNVAYIKNGGSGFFEKNNTKRITTQLGIKHTLSEFSNIQLKNSYTAFDRLIAIPAYTFDALQQSSFTELTWNYNREKINWVLGGNILTDHLKEHQRSADPVRDYQYNTYGLFLQHTFTASDYFTLEAGMRGDYVSQFGFEWLPRISGMLKISPALTTRLGGGFGYKTPSVFTEESERMRFQNVLPVDIHSLQNERSIGGNWDINYRTNIGRLGLSFNHLFYYTRLNRPLVLTAAAAGKMQFQHASGFIDTKGVETNLKLLYGDFKLFIGYTYTDANTHFSNEQQWLPLTARHRLNNVLMYEIEEKLKLGLEAYYFSPQRLNDGSSGKPYWITGFMAEKLWEKFSVFINFENFTGTRQSKFDNIYTGSIDNPIFKDIYAPVEGFVINGGIKVRL